MKILFLDFDGVLNSSKYLDKQKGDVLDPKAIELLNQVISKTFCKVVISSTWRLSYTIEELRLILANNGFKGEVIGVTGKGFEGNRGKQIQEWLNSHQQVSNFAIVDDDKFDLMELQANCVFTSFLTGITQLGVDGLIKLLGES